MKLVAPNNRRKFEVIIVGTGLAGASAAATLGELGYNVKVFTYHDSPRRAHSIAAQGGINAAKNYKGDGDSVQRLFYDTVKGGDFRSREANVHRLAEVSVDIIDQCVAQGVPFAREYGGLLDNRSFGGAQVSRTFYARGQTGQQLLLGAYQPLMHQVHAGTVELHTRTEMLDLVVKDGVAVRRRRPRPRHRRRSAATRPTPCCCAPAATATSSSSPPTPSTPTPRRRGGPTAGAPCSPTPATRRSTPPASRRSDEFQSKLTLMSESLRNDGRIWVPKNPDETRSPDQIPEDERDYFLERKYPSFGNLVPRDVASRNAKTMVDEGKGVGPLKNGVYLDFADAIEPRRRGRRSTSATATSSTCTSASPTRTRTRSRCASTPPSTTRWAGSGWTTTSCPTCPACSCSARPTSPTTAPTASAPRRSCRAWPTATSSSATRSPTTWPACSAPRPCPVDDPAFAEAQQAVDDRVKRFLSIGGTKSVDHYHRELGKIMWDYCGMARNKTGLEKALSEIPALREEFWKDVRVLGDGPMNQCLEKAGRVADFFELGELMVRDALAPRGVLRRPLPRGAPDRGRRGPPRRRALRLRGGLGVGRRGRHARRATRSRSRSSTST